MLKRYRKSRTIFRHHGVALVEARATELYAY
jgi:hypothetical protein